jgi:hypothetical protein
MSHDPLVSWFWDYIIWVWDEFKGWKVEGCRLKSADMKFDPQKHHRRSIRLKDYDYS